MDKHGKLKRYRRKDYDRILDFPVEIVGRDGQVRVYSFEESVRLYQRRIETSSLRYGDAELVEAEIQHCRRRIAQLRRSYFQRFAWPGLARLAADEALRPEHAGELAAFLRRELEESEPPVEELELDLLHAEPGLQVFSLSTSPPSLLYLYQAKPSSGGEDGQEHLEAFLGLLAENARSRPEEGEFLKAVHRSGDLAIVLTSSEPPPEPEPFSLPDEEDFTPGPLELGLAALRRGDALAALRVLGPLAEAQPGQREALLGAVLAATVGRDYGQAEFYARLGTYHHPADPLFRFHLGWILAQRGQLEEGRESLEEARRLDPGLPAVSLALAVVEARLGHLDRAISLLDRHAPAAPSPAVAGFLELLRRHRRRRRFLRALGALAVLASLLLAFTAPLAAPLPLAGVGLLGLGLLRLWSRRERRLHLPLEEPLAPLPGGASGAEPH